jgi:hypothetical protein
MSAYQIVNGVPRPIATPLQKVDWQKHSEMIAATPRGRLEKLGFTSKQAFILELSSGWETIEKVLNNGGGKDEVISAAAQYGIKF